MALSLVVAVMAGAVPAQWPVRSELFQVALAISFYSVAVTPSRITAFVAATFAAAAGQCGVRQLTAQAEHRHAIAEFRAAAPQTSKPASTRCCSKRSMRLPGCSARRQADITNGIATGHAWLNRQGIRESGQGGPDLGIRVGAPGELAAHLCRNQGVAVRVDAAACPAQTALFQGDALVPRVCRARPAGRAGGRS